MASDGKEKAAYAGQHEAQPRQAGTGAPWLHGNAPGALGGGDHAGGAVLQRLHHAMPAAAASNTLIFRGISFSSKKVSAIFCCSASTALLMGLVP